MPAALAWAAEWSRESPAHGGSLSSVLAWEPGWEG